jgi:fido (protein-threonine AMPylation protein)
LIHPFDDGNGRVARALTSLILMENGLLPFNVYDAIKEKYSEVLNIALVKNDFNPLVNLIIEQQWNLLEFLENANYDNYIKEQK